MGSIICKMIKVMIKFYILSYFILSISFFAFAQSEEIRKDEQNQLFAYKQLILDDKFQKILEEYGFQDTIYIKRDMNIFGKDKILEDLIKGKTICIFSREYLFMSGTCYYLRIKCLEWDNQIEAHIKTCSEGICNVNYYRQKFIFEKKDGKWVRKKYQTKKYTPTKENISPNSF